jgi:hypothetical protein
MAVRDLQPLLLQSSIDQYLVGSELANNVLLEKEISLQGSTCHIKVIYSQMIAKTLCLEDI